MSLYGNEIMNHLSTLDVVWDVTNDGGMGY